jgi:hypothetical protein
MTVARRFIAGREAHGSRKRGRVYTKNKEKLVFAQRYLPSCPRALGASQPGILQMKTAGLACAVATKKQFFPGICVLYRRDPLPEASS